ncbi:hypothetical protein ACWGJP_03725 [Microbacterium sp. NPDC055903]
MQAVFTDIVNGDEQKVRERIAKDPSLVDAVATGQPKQYAGQSALQVAIRSGAFSIAMFLLASGADPNFADTGSPSGWAKSVLHDALAAAVKRSRWVRLSVTGSSEKQWLPVNSLESADAAFQVLIALLDAGADVHAVDSKGTTPLGRAARAAQEVLPRRRDDQPDRSDDKPLNAELVADLARIFGALVARGADPERVEPQLDMSLAYYYELELVGKFLAGTVQPDTAS